MNEDETRAELIDPKLKENDWELWAAQDYCKQLCIRKRRQSFLFQPGPRSVKPR